MGLRRVIRSGRKRFRKWRRGALPDTKIFLIGLHRTGTRSLHAYFTSCGLKSFHGGLDQGLGERIIINIVLGRKALHRIDDYEVYSDLGAVRDCYKQLEQDYPDAKFILNTRDVNRWLLSCLNHIEGRHVEFVNLSTRRNLGWQQWVEIWRKDFHDHEQAVMEHFRDKPDRFLRFDIETGRVADLIAFLGDKRLKPVDVLPPVGVTDAKTYVLDGDRIVKREPD